MIRAEDIDLAPPIPLWFPSASVTTGAGYKDNLVLSRFARDESSFLKTGLDLFLMRLPKDGRQFHLSISGEDFRYFSGDSVEKEQLLFGQTQFIQELGPASEGSMALEYVYLDQVLDVSTTETNLMAARVRGHQIQANPGFKRGFGEFGWVELSFPVGRYFFDATVDDYWEGGPKLTLGRPYGHKSEWTVSFAYGYRAYDTRPRVEAEGTPIPNTSLAYHQPKIELAWKHYLDHQQRWRTGTKLSYKQNLDNGNGFFDFIRLQAAQQLQFRSKTWELGAEVRVAQYDYARQRVSATDGSVRRRTELGANLRCKKEVTRWLRLFAEYEFEQVLARHELEEYSVNVVSGGLTWEF